MIANRSVFVPRLSRLFSQEAARRINASKLSNGISVASHEDASPVSSVAICIKTGPRFEDSSSLAHSVVLKNMSFEDTKKRTRIYLTRKMDNDGSNLHVSLSRELLIIRADFLANKFDDSFELISSIVTNPDFSYHRVERSKSASVEDVHYNSHCGDVKMMEAVHKTAFRTGLGNSLFPSDRLIHSVTETSLSKFASQSFLPNNIAVIGAGVDYQKLFEICNATFGRFEGSSSTTASKYHGGDSVYEAFGDKNRYAIAFEGASLNSNEKYTQMVLEALLDGQSHVQGGKGASRLSLNAPGFECFSVQYSDSGLFGFYGKSKQGSLSEAAEKALKELESVSSAVSESELATAKTKAKSALLIGVEKKETLIDYMASQLLLTQSLTSPVDTASSIDKVTASDVQKLALKYRQSKPTTVLAQN